MHSGTLSFGHYITYRVLPSGKWARFNDDEVVFFNTAKEARGDFSKNQSKFVPYLLLYKRWDKPCTFPLPNKSLISSQPISQHPEEEHFIRKKSLKTYKNKQHFRLYKNGKQMQSTSIARNFNNFPKYKYPDIKISFSRGNKEDYSSSEDEGATTASSSEACEEDDYIPSEDEASCSSSQNSLTFFEEDSSVEESVTEFDLLENYSLSGEDLRYSTDDLSFQHYLECIKKVIDPRVLVPSLLPQIAKELLGLNKTRNYPLLETLKKGASNHEQALASFLNYLIEGGTLYPARLKDKTIADWYLLSLQTEIMQHTINNERNPYINKFVQLAKKAAHEPLTYHLTQALKAWRKNPKTKYSLGRLCDVLELLLVHKTIIIQDKLDYEKPLLSLYGQVIVGKLTECEQFTKEEKQVIQNKLIKWLLHKNRRCSATLLDNLLEGIINSKNKGQVDVAFKYMTIDFVTAPNLEQAIILAKKTRSEPMLLDYTDCFFYKRLLQALQKDLIPAKVRWIKNALWYLFKSIKSYKERYKWVSDYFPLPDCLEVDFQPETVSLQKVLLLTGQYQLPAKEYASLLPILKTEDKHKWEEKTHKLLLEYTFGECKNFTLEQLIEQIADDYQKQGLCDVNDTKVFKEFLRKTYKQFSNSYNRPSIIYPVYDHTLTHKYVTIKFCL